MKVNILIKELKHLCDDFVNIQVYLIDDRGSQLDIERIISWYEEISDTYTICVDIGRQVNESE